MVGIALALVHKGADDLLCKSREGQGNAEFARGLQGVVEVLLVQSDAEAGVEVALYHHGALGVENIATGESTLDGIKYDVGIQARLLSKYECFTNRRDVDGDHYLVGELCGVARAVVAAECGAAHRREYIHVLVVHVLLAADHDCERA